jgi:hypothetical protein
MGVSPDVRWRWEADDSDVRIGYLAMDGRVSLDQLIETMRELAPDVAPRDIQVNWATVVWSRPATPEELAERQQWRDRQAERTERWERDTLARLARKYGGQS